MPRDYKQVIDFFELFERRTNFNTSVDEKIRDQLADNIHRCKLLTFDQRQYVLSHVDSE